MFSFVPFKTVLEIKPYNLSINAVSDLQFRYNAGIRDVLGFNEP